MSCPHHDNDVADGVRQQDNHVRKAGQSRFLRLVPRRWCPACRQATLWASAQTAAADNRIARGLQDMQADPLPVSSLDRLLEALGLPTLPPLSEVERAQLRAQMRRLLLLIGFILFVTTLMQPELIASKAIENLWFGRTVPDALQTAGLWMLMGLGWAAKPFFALVAPRVLSEWTCLRILAGSGLLAALLWLALDHVHLASAIAVLSIGIGSLLALASVVMGGLLVEQGQRLGATGRLGALHAAAIFLARLTGAGVVGLLGTGTLHQTAPFCALVLLGFALLCGALLKGRKAGQKQVLSESFDSEADLASGMLIPERVTPERHRLPTWSVLQTVLRSRNMWGTACIAVLVYIAPNFGALQHQENMRLGFSAGAQDSLDFVGGLCGLVGVGGYLWLCRRLPLQTLLLVGILCNAAGTLLYLGYQSLPTALLIEGANGLLSALVFAMLFDLAIRAIPRGTALLGYALLTGLIAFTSHLSNVFGSWLTMQAGWGFMQVVSLSAGLSLPALAIVALLPAALLDRREGKIITAEPATTFLGGLAPQATFEPNA